MKYDTPPPSSLLQLEARLEATQRQHPSFPSEEVMLVRMLKLLHKMIGDTANSKFREFGLSDAEYHILLGLSSVPEGLSPSEIAEQICEKAANTSRLLDQLQGKGLISREPSSDDRRRLIVKASPQASQLIEDLLPAVGAQMHDLFDGVSVVQRQQFKALLSQLLSKVDAFS